MNLSRIVCGISQKIQKKLWQREKNDIFVLMFHEVVKCGDNPCGSWNFAITDDRFEKFLDMVAKHCEFVSIDDICKKDMTGATVTFDDVYKSVFENAVPILTRKNIPFTVFITPSFLDKKGYLTREDLKALVDMPLCTVGYHTLNHVGMREFADESAVQEAIDPATFNAEFGISCEYFAYPYGSRYMCPARVRKVVAESVYKAAFGTVHSGTNKHMIERERFYIPRLNLSEQSFDEVAAYIGKTAH